MTTKLNGHAPVEQSVIEPGADDSGIKWGKADLHMHTSHGDGLASVKQIFEYVENYTDLDVIAITDHDDIRGAMEALDLIEKRKWRFQAAL